LRFKAFHKFSSELAFQYPIGNLMLGHLVLIDK
jgi:hypothetical protein